MNKKNTPSSDTIIETIEELSPGRAAVYYTGLSGWLGGSRYKVLLKWLSNEARFGLYDFTQRKLEGKEFEYIARRRLVPSPKLID